MSSQISSGKGISHMTPASSSRSPWGTLTTTPNELGPVEQKSGNVHYKILVLKEVSQAFSEVVFL